MRLITLLMCFITLMGLASKSWGADYTGIWKSDCSNYFGLQIMPAEDDLYSVSFCGLISCFKPGEWTPNTRIEGDPKYRIISPRELLIKRSDGTFSSYTKCTNDPSWIVEKHVNAEPVKFPDCSFASEAEDSGVLIAWITGVRKTTQFGRGIETQTTIVGPFRPVARISGTAIEEDIGETIYKEQHFWNVLSPASEPLELSSVGSFLDHMGVDHCVYFGTFGEANPSLWTLLSSKPIPGVFNEPTSKDNEDFYSLNKSCVQQGDYPENQAPPCVRPTLLALTDINNNGKPEYWATEPYIWDTGLTVWENNEGALIPLLQVCVGCSD